MAKLTVLDREIAIHSSRDVDYICITDMARYKDADRTDYIIQNWLRNRNTIEFLGIWEQLNNPAFKPIEFDGFRKQAGLNSFSLTAKRWIEATNAIGLISRSGRHGGTYAHKDIAFEFASWIKEWRDSYPDDKGNIRDHANVSQLVCLSNLENLNAHFIQEKMPQPERLRKLNEIAIQQVKLLSGLTGIAQLEGGQG